MPMSLAGALLVAVAMIVGVCVILVGAVLIAAGLAALIDPDPVRSRTPEEERSRAEYLRQEDELWERQQDRREEVRGRTSIDSTHVSFRAFGMTFVGVLLLASMSVVLAHADDPGEGFPLQLLLRPLWIALLIALLAGSAAGAAYKRRFSKLPAWRQREVRERQRAEKDRRYQRRLKDIRDRALGRKSSRHY